MGEMPLPPGAASWQKSSASGEAGCVQVARAPACVWVGDSKNPIGPVLGFSNEQWKVVLVGLQRDEFGTPES